MSKLSVVPSPDEGNKQYDPFDPENMRLSQATLKSSAKKLITNYTVRKTPRKGSYFRVHPDPAYQYITYIYLDKDEAGLDKETYLVTPRFAAQLDDEYKSVMQSVVLYLAIERHSEKPFVWRVGIPLDGAKDNQFWSSAREKAELAKTMWIRIATGVGCYDHYEPLGKIKDPVWPEIPFGEILRLAFKNRVIDSMDHPIMQALAGADE